ncbi:MAG: AI-2E family transporter, partial [Lachnospiraceae bacterium]|nr:AI-2E family transporter [Lachnospiraceae bacterium]
ILKIPSYFTNDMLPVLTKWGSNFDKLADKYNVEYDISSILTTVGGKLSSLSTSIVSFTGNVAVSVPGFIVNLIICVMSTYFFTADLTLFKEFIYKQLSGKAVNIIDNAVRLFFVNIGRYVKSYALIVLITFCELFISFLIIGIKGSFYIAMIIAIFDILPIVGCGTILLPWLVYAIVKGNSSLAIGLAIVYIIVTIVRNIIEPRIVGKQVGLHPLLTLAGMIVGTYVFGPLGLLGLPIALTIIKDLNEQEIIHLYRQ